MLRIASYNFTCCLYFLCFSTIGFTLGIYYLKFYVRFPCTSSKMTTIRIAYSTYDHFEYRTISTCQNRSFKIFLTVVVLSSYERLLIYLPSILNTWILTATIEIEIIIFIEEQSLTTENSIKQIFLDLNRNLNHNIKACLFIVKLRNVENNYPPQKKSFYAMKFLYAFYRYRTLWVLRLDDNAYVHIEELVKFLKSVNYKQALYIGQGGSGRRNGAPISFPHGEYFCMGGSGVILSKSTLTQLGPWLDHCLYNETLTPHEDVELGRCILNHVHISCSKALNAKSLFYHHYGPQYSFGYDFTPSIMSQALVLHPIKDRNTFQQIYAFYIREKRNRKQFTHINAPLKPLIRRKDYATFLSGTEFDISKNVVYQKLNPIWKSYIERTIQAYIEKSRLVFHQSLFKWIFTYGKLVFGYYRLISTYGIHVNVEVQLNVYTASNSSNSVRKIQRQFHIYQRFLKKSNFEYREIKLDEESNEKSHQLNIIVVASDKDEALLRFVNNFQNEILNHPSRRKHFTLTILYFSLKTKTNNRTISVIFKLSVKYQSIIRISLADGNQTNYNRGLGRQLASELFTSDQVLFFLDVDLVFTGQALDNTRRLMMEQLSTSSCRVYFPIVYSYFSNMFAVHDKKSINSVNSKNGLFSIYGFGNVALRKHDLDTIGGWETNNHDWGLEDVNLFHRLNDPTLSCYVFRTVEPNLRHNYHGKMCNGIGSRIREQMCREADAMLIGSQGDMANYIIKKKLKY